MSYLLISSLVWAFSFGLVKHKLVAAGVDPNLVTWIRLALSLLLFIPFVRWRKTHGGLAGRLFLIGAVQYGVMYVAYTNAFLYMAAHEVAMFTIFTPIYVTLIHDRFRRRFHPLCLLAAVLAVVGSAVIVCKPGNGGRALLVGVLLVQISNLAFAFGQVRYRLLMQSWPMQGAGQKPARDLDVFAWMYLGGLALATVPAWFTSPVSQIHLAGGQVLTLLYLGLVPSGIGFFLWNVGARKAKPGTLAVFNNVKIPLAVLCSLVFFGERADLVHLLIGGAVMVAAVFINERSGVED